MSRKKRRRKPVFLMGKKLKKTKPAIYKYSHEIIGLVIIATGVLFMFASYIPNSIGPFGELMRKVLLGLLGIPVFAMLPLFLFLGVTLMLKKDSQSFKKKIIYLFLFIVLISCFLQLAVSEPTDTNLDFWDITGGFITNGFEMTGGGLIGGVLTLPLIPMFGVAGTWIILITLSIIDIVLLTEISIVSFLRKIRDGIAAVFSNMRSSAKAPAKKPAKVKHPLSTVENRVKRRGLFGRASETELPMEYASTTEQILTEEAFRQALDVEIRNSEQSERSVAPVVTEKDKAEVASEIQKHIGAIDASGYKLPPTNLLTTVAEDWKKVKVQTISAADGAKKLEETLLSFGVEAKVIKVSPGPSVTRYEVQPSQGVKVAQILRLVDDIALNLAAAGVRIEAPIPGKAAIGIEVANKEITIVYLKDILETEEFRNHPSKIAIALGKEISGECVIANIANMPHVLIAGSTGSGKSVCLNSLIISILYRATPADVRIMMIDPKVVELGMYNGIPHLLMPVVTNPKKAAGALNWAVKEMLNRYDKFAEKGVRDLKGYNSYVEMENETDKLPQIIIIIDELADLMMVAPAEVEDSICRLAQMARAAGIHLIIATQRPSVDVITGIIKANIPTRIAFAVSSTYDSRTILDMVGAERLLGKGDMLYYPVGRAKPIRVQGAYVNDQDVNKVVEFVKRQSETSYNEEIIEHINSGAGQKETQQIEADEFLPRAIEIVVDAKQASSSYLSRKLGVGYPRAAKLIDQMEERGIVGKSNGSKPREVLITKEQLQEMQMRDQSDHR